GLGSASFPLAPRRGIDVLDMHSHLIKHLGPGAAISVNKDHVGIPRRWTRSRPDRRRYVIADMHGGHPEHTCHIDSSVAYRNDRVQRGNLGSEIVKVDHLVNFWVVDDAAAEEPQVRHIVI